MDLEGKQREGQRKERQKESNGESIIGDLNTKEEMNWTELQENSGTCHDTG